MRFSLIGSRIVSGIWRGSAAPAFVVSTLLTIAQAAPAAELDVELKDGIDFRDIAFKVCFQAEQCQVKGLVVRAETRQSDSSPWKPGLLYWDPIDGLGVLGGGQDDEIDFNERIVLRPSETLSVKKVWLSDLFSGEITHYRGMDPALPSDVDFEAGRITFPTVSGDAREVELRGLRDLPDSPFNDAIDGAIFIEPGDLHYRLLIVEGEALLSIPFMIEGGRREHRIVRLNRIEPGKLNLFSDGEELVYDLEEVFGDTEIVELFPIGRHNASKMASIVGQTRRLSRMSANAGLRRDVGDIPNGEVAVEFDVAFEAMELVFHAPAGTSNDFSVAGLVLAK